MEPSMPTTTRRVPRTGRAVVTVAAPIEAVWRVIADVTRTGQWSHECLDVRWLRGATGASPGVRFRGRNRSRWVRWSRTCEVLAVDAPRRIAWRTIATPLFPDSTDWVISLEPAGAGTRIRQTYEVTFCPRWWEWIAVRAVPAHVDRTDALTDDLRRLGAVAAADARVGGTA
jgi:uncharacterized protein YndB with AHSA1/START domain